MTPVPEHCAMIEAALLVDDPRVQRFFRGEACGDSTGARIIVDAKLDPPVDLRAGCESTVFVLYRDGQRMETDALLQLSIVRKGPIDYHFGASYIDPPNSPGDRLTDGSFEDTNYYCHVIGGRLRREASGWRAWIE